MLWYRIYQNIQKFLLLLSVQFINHTHNHVLGKCKVKACWIFGKIMVMLLLGGGWISLCSVSYLFAWILDVLVIESPMNKRCLLFSARVSLWTVLVISDCCHGYYWAPSRIQLSPKHQGPLCASLCHWRVALTSLTTSWSSWQALLSSQRYQVYTHANYFLYNY